MSNMCWALKIIPYWSTGKALKKGDDFKSNPSVVVIKSL